MPPVVTRPPGVLHERDGDAALRRRRLGRAWWTVRAGVWEPGTPGGVPRRRRGPGAPGGGPAPRARPSVRGQLGLPRCLGRGSRASGRGASACAEQPPGRWSGGPQGATRRRGQNAQDNSVRTGQSGTYVPHIFLHVTGSWGADCRRGPEVAQFCDSPDARKSLSTMSSSDNVTNETPINTATRCR